MLRVKQFLMLGLIVSAVLAGEAKAEFMQQPFMQQPMGVQSPWMQPQPQLIGVRVNVTARPIFGGFQSPYYYGQGYNQFGYGQYNPYMYNPYMNTNPYMFGGSHGMMGYPGGMWGRPMCGGYWRPCHKRRGYKRFTFSFGGLFGFSITKARF